MMRKIISYNKSLFSLKNDDFIFYTEDEINPIVFIFRDNCFTTEEFEECNLLIDNLKFTKIEYNKTKIIQNLNKIKLNPTDYSLERNTIRMFLELKRAFSYTNCEDSILFLKNVKDIITIKMLEDSYFSEARSFQDDALSMYKTGNYMLALDCVKRTYPEIIGYVVTKETKRYSSLFIEENIEIFLNEEGFGNFELYKKICDYYVFPKIKEENVIDYLEISFLIIQNMMSSTLFF